MSLFLPLSRITCRGAGVCPLQSELAQLNRTLSSFTGEGGMEILETFLFHREKVILQQMVSGWIGRWRNLWVDGWMDV
jgi:hypothetical protein